VDTTHQDRTPQKRPPSVKQETHRLPRSEWRTPKYVIDLACSSDGEESDDGTEDI